MLDTVVGTTTVPEARKRPSPSNNELEGELKNLLFALEGANKAMIRKHIRSVHEITGLMLADD